MDPNPPDPRQLQSQRRASRWGASLDIDTVKGTGTGSPQTINVFGRVAAGQTAAPGPYSDTITVTITY